MEEGHAHVPSQHIPKAPCTPPLGSAPLVASVSPPGADCPGMKLVRATGICHGAQTARSPHSPPRGSTPAPAPRLLIWKSVALSGPVFIYLAFHTQFSAWVAYGVPLTGPPGRPPGPTEA